MTDNSKNRLHDVFFYGLYMDPDVLEQKGVQPRNPRIAKVEGYELRIGSKATLLRERGGVAYGVVYSLTHSEINSLYWGAGLDAYAAEALLAKIGEDNQAVLCCNLVEPPAKDESNPEYGQKLAAAMKKLGVPCDFG